MLISLFPRARVCTLLLSALLACSAFGLETTGTLDAGFNAGNFTDGQVTVTLIQPDGKFLVAGQFTKANGIARQNIARFNPDGTLDTLFDPGTGLDFGPRGMILQSDNKILIYGNFSTVNDVPRFAGIARLNSNGSLDTAFDPGNVISYDGLDDGAGNATNNGFVYAAVLLPGGKILVFGEFYYVLTGPGTRVDRSCVARFNSDGSFDASYNPGTGFTSLAGPNLANVQYVVRQTLAPNDDKVIVSGGFDGFNGSAASRMLRLNAAGAYDATFTPGTSTPVETVAGLFEQADGQIVVYGSFQTYDGAARKAIVRLSSAGVVDPGFTPAEFKDYGDPGTIAAVAQQANGKLIVGGYFHTLGGVAANNVARLELNGTRDGSFDSTTGAMAMGFNIAAVAIRTSDQAVLLGGWFPAYNNVNRNNLVLALSNGSIDPAFAPSSGVTDADPEIFALATQPDGKVIVAGVFTVFNGAPLHNIVRLNPDGSRDATFGITSGTSRSVRAMAVQADGKIVIAGTFTAIDGVAQGRVARLLSNGTVDPSFNPGTGPDNIVYAVAVDADGSVYLGGDFRNVNGTPRERIAKLTSTGALDPTFNPGTGFNATVRAITPSNSVLGPVIGGTFTTYNGATVGRIVRVDATTGARDVGFNAGGTSFNSTVRALLLTPEGKYLVGGNFTTFNSGPPVARSRLARLTATGVLDGTFVGPTMNGFVRALALPGDGKIVAGGTFNMPTFKQVARFSSTGTLDPTFSTGSGAISSPANAFALNNSSVDALAFGNGGKLFAGGIFNQYNGIARTSLVRLTDSTLLINRVLHPANMHFVLNISGAPNTTYALEVANDPSPMSFGFLANFTTDGAGQFSFDDASAVGLLKRFYRATLPVARESENRSLRGSNPQPPP